jgi:hypothetical protein
MALYLRDTKQVEKVCGTNDVTTSPPELDLEVAETQ